MDEITLSNWYTILILFHRYNGTKHMRKIFHLVLISGLLGLSFSGHAALEKLNGVAAVVNNHAITTAQLQQRITQVKKQLQSQKIKLPPADILAQQVLQMLINANLEQQTAQRLNIKATTEDIQRAIQSLAAQQKMTAAQFRAELTKRGIPETAFLQQIKQEIISQKLMRETLAAQIKVTPQEIAAGVKTAQAQAGKNNEYHLLHILVPLSDSPSPAQIKTAKGKADLIIQQLKQGEDFKTLAAASSQGQQMFNGGDMGWKTLNQLPTVFADKVINMKKGDIAGPIQTPNGFHILKLVGMRGKAMVKDSKQLQAQVAQMIFQRKMAEKQQDWLSQLRASAYIKIYYKPSSLPEPQL